MANKNTKPRWYVIGAITDPKDCVGTAIAIQGGSPEAAIEEFERKFKMKGIVMGMFKDPKTRIFRRVIINK